ncbi:hypothetical protein SODALDRAFT_329785 [Sodiomyces alkalinus F11]|uniref:Uncharacterized protein n=1 Tax=Sodiomyces alkalinus (strain CBS 110278 / VKM F-3762 / F11) TaxID=1314773 RepID=A0A3N2PJH6_SODAK|nr:hypothetical protein SODALDRAFT_329785 [Sodiomyces alkalinus F11]ROT34534.1 hypothetical protein SODALDRAFT_329785 [Sodiomyces alkalinus F11]
MAWPDPEVQDRYRQWQCDWTGRVADRLVRDIPQSEFLDRVLATNFGSASSRAQHLWMMEMLNTPFCLLGESDFGNSGVFTGYAMDPGPAYLWPNLESQHDVGLVSPNILGINLGVRVEGDFVLREGPATTVSPRKRRREEARSSGEDTVRSADSRDADHPGGFIFVQLGALYAYNGTKPWAEARTLGRDTTIPGPWRATGFGVVLEIDARGRPGAVWVIYNFHTIEDNDSDERKHCHIPTRAEGSVSTFPYIGRLTPACNETFTIAKIAESLAELKNESAKIDFRVMDTVERQIVRVKTYSLTPGMPLVRQFAKE